MKVPGTFWVALVTFVSIWLPQLVPGAPWLPYAVLGLAALLKAVEVLTDSQPRTIRGVTRAETGWQMVGRWLVG